MITTRGADLSNATFDFVIAGGGTAGLALAARLSENPLVTVAVLEAGDGTVGDPKIAIPAQFGFTLGDPKYDWCFHTAKQQHSNDQQLPWSRGKGLGGSSAMNFYAWTRPPAADVDAWEKLGNPGWNWADYLRYSKKVETFHPPAKEQTDRFPHTYDADIRGTSGPIHVTIPPHVHTVDALVQRTLVNMGIRVIEDPYKGDISGTWIGSANLDPKTWTRSYSATAYLSPSQNRPNLTVLLGALASRITFADESDDLGLTATGLEFIHQGKRYVVNAQKEVILSAGVPKSSQILELSGVGRADVLSRIGVEPKIKLPGVGENLQEHEFFAVSYELNPATKHETPDLLRESEYAREALQLHAEGKGIMRTGITSFTYIPLSSVKTPGAAKLVQKIEREIEEWKNEPGILPGFQKQLDMQLATLRDDSLPDFEIVAFPGLFSTTATPGPGKFYTSFMGFLNHPLSRGTVHATTNDPEDNPEINPHYFEKDSDLELMVQTFKYIRRMVHTEPLKSGIVQPEVEPGPHCTTDEHIRDFIKNTHHTVWHGVGTCSMLPRDEQGVVDPSLKVYGTTNVRVVDLSVVPLHIAAHAQSTAYVIAEKAAHIISSAHEPVL